MQPKRILISVLVVILMFGVAAISVAAAQTPFELAVGASSSAAISNQPVFLQAGDTLEVNISVSSNPGVSYLYFYLDYDKSALTLATNEDGSVAYKVGEVFGAEYIEVFIDKNGRTRCLIDALDLNKDNDKTGELITFTFTVNKDFHGSTEVSADISSKYITDIQWNDIEVVAGKAEVHVHAYGEPVIVEATCTQGGSTTYTCTTCKEPLVINKTDAIGHKAVVDEAVAPTCTDTGLTEGSHCSVCNEVIVKQEIRPALGHKEEIVAGKPGTCTEPGISDGKKCTVCGATTVAQQATPALGHKEETVAGKAVTCTETGISDGKKCSVCGVTTVEQSVTSALGHTEETVAGKAATCTASGLTDGKKCKICNVTTVEQNIIPVIEHTEVVLPGKEANCLETGLTEGKKCSICGTIIIGQTAIPALGHTPVVDAAVEATCTTAGKTEGKHCSVCNTVLVAQSEVPAKGHTEVKDEAVEPTYSEEGKTEGSHCSVCNEVLKAQETVAKKSPIWIWVAVAAGVLVVGGVLVALMRKRK